jgi:DNA-binding transcriptional LysR family regulator
VRDLDLTTLRLFVTVCERGNIARAGEEEGIVGSAISKRIAALEDEFGVKLLARRRHGVAPTPAGETLLEHARAMLGRGERIRNDMASFSAGVKGRIRVLATASVLAERLADDLAEFLKNPDYRNIRVDIEERLSVDVVRGIRDGVASLGICWDAADFQGLETLAYRRDRLAVVMHPGHPLAGYETLPFKATLDYEQVSLSSASAVQSMLKHQAMLAGKPLIERIFVSNLNAMLPMEVVSAYANTDELRVIPLSDEWAWRRFAICYRPGDGLPPAAGLLARHLAQCGLG